jgi:hypothetical protein
MKALTNHGVTVCLRLTGPGVRKVKVCSGRARPYQYLTGTRSENRRTIQKTPIIMVESSG